MGLKSTLRNLLRATGFDVVPFTPQEHALARRTKLLASLGVDLVLDVGANAGQFASGLRALGYRGRLVSFEPLSAAHAALERAAHGDAAWETHRLALGDRAGSAQIHVASNSYSSSLLEMLPRHLAAAPGSRFVADETVQTETLDALFPGLRRDAARCYLKIDTQGFEKRVLDGAQQALAQIDTVQLEMSLVPLYQGEPLFEELHRYLGARGYQMVGLEPGFTDPATGRLLQADGVFHRDRG